VLTTYFPEVAAAVVEQVPSGTVLDGELVVYRGGRCEHREHGYRPRQRSWWKVRTRVTVDAVVGGHRARRSRGRGFVRRRMATFVA
jgi:ATP-dependent DNA ligase